MGSEVGTVYGAVGAAPSWARISAGTPTACTELRAFERTLKPHGTYGPHALSLTQAFVSHAAMRMRVTCQGMRPMRSAARRITDVTDTCREWWIVD